MFLVETVQFHISCGLMPRKGAKMLRKLLKRLVVPAAVASLGLFAASTVKAESVLVDVGSPIVSPAGSNFKWSYNVSVTSSATVQKDDFFVIVDFTGFVAGTNFQPANWAFTTETVTTPITGISGTVSASGDSSTVNLRWTYTGGVTLGPGIPLGTFGAESTQNKRAPGVLLAQDHNFNPGSASDGLIDVNSQSIDVPAAVPLPASAGLGLVLLAGLGGATVLRRRAQKA